MTKGRHLSPSFTAFNSLYVILVSSSLIDRLRRGAPRIEFQPLYQRPSPLQTVVAAQPVRGWDESRGSASTLSWIPPNPYASLQPRSWRGNPAKKK